MTLSLGNSNGETPTSFNRRSWLSRVASLAMFGRFEGNFASAFNANRPGNDRDNDDEWQRTVNQTGSIVASWLEPQIGFPLAHEQFKVPELVELGIAAEQPAFDLLAVSDLSSRGRTMKGIWDKPGSPWPKNPAHSDGNNRHLPDVSRKEVLPRLCSVVRKAA